jgi:hypothetical protein
MGFICREHVAHFPLAAYRVSSLPHCNSVAKGVKRTLLQEIWETLRRVAA